MNISEANELNTLLRYVLAEPDIMGKVPTCEQAATAAEGLADRANRALGAGLDGRTVREAWALLELPGRESEP